MSELSVNLSKTISAPIERVFDAWLNPEMLKQFILPAPGMDTPDVDNDPVEGGRFTIVMKVGDDEIPHAGTYVVLDRPNRLVFSWESPFSTDGSEVSLDFKSIDQSNTQVDLVHTRFQDEEARGNHEGGWTNILEKLAEVA